jgi:hypothetical protein
LIVGILIVAFVPWFTRVLTEAFGIADWREKWGKKYHGTKCNQSGRPVYDDLRKVTGGS